jgi:hypothetical protein
MKERKKKKKKHIKCGREKDIQILFFQMFFFLRTRRTTNSLLLTGEKTKCAALPVPDEIRKLAAHLSLFFFPISLVAKVILYAG